MNDEARKEINDIAKTLAGAVGDAMPDRYEENPGLMYKAVNNLRNAWRAVRGEDVFSVQDRFYQKGIDALVSTITYWARVSERGPSYPSMTRDKWLHRQVFTKTCEPILAGAIHTFTAKIQTLNWFLEGPEDLLEESAEILENADFDDWTRFLGRWVESYCIYDIGGLAEIGREKDDDLSPVRGIYNLDSTQCAATKNYDKPFKYYEPESGEGKSLGRNGVMQILSMPNPSETKRGYGLSPVTRVLRVSQILDALYNYEEERLLNLPPNAVATITGMTMSQVETAMNMHKQARLSKDMKTYPGILWFVAQKLPFGGKQQPVDVKLTPFSSLPEYFDKATTIQLFAKTLAITFGVDVAEFWQIETHGATKAQATIQAQKAKGKGVGLLMSQIEREINRKVLPNGVNMHFDVQDDEDDLLKAEVRGAKIENVRSLYWPKAATGGAEGMMLEPLITREEARWLLARDGILPKELIEGLGVKPLEPTAHFRIYSHAMKGLLPERNPFPRDYEGMRYALKMLRDELEDELRKGRRAS